MRICSMKWMEWWEKITAKAKNVLQIVIYYTQFRTQEDDDDDGSQNSGARESNSKNSRIEEAKERKEKKNVKREGTHPVCMTHA